MIRLQRRFDFVRSAGFSQLSSANLGAQPETPANKIASASGWAVNRRPQDATN